MYFEVCMSEIKQNTVDVAKKEAKLAEFFARMEAERKWAKEVGLTEEILYDEIKKMHMENSKKQKSA